jgi:hypothetical protein
MKKIIVVTGLIMLLPSIIYACDICGCGVGSSYIGLLPEFNKKIFGLRYRYNSLRSHIGAGGTITYLTSDEKYHIVEAWGGWNITSRIRIMATVPLNINERYNQGKTTGKSGIGDVSANVFYQLLNKRSVEDGKMIIQSLYAGAGIKLPVGKYNPSDKESNNENPNLFQLGTGSVDFNVAAIYDLRIQDAGLNTSVNYKINTVNRYSYQYGNKLSGSIQAYYKLRVADMLTLAPNAGILYETGAKDMDDHLRNDQSGGNLLLGTVGLEVTFKKISIGGNWQTPLKQNLASGFVKANNKMMAHISFLL